MKQISTKCEPVDSEVPTAAKVASVEKIVARRLKGRPREFDLEKALEAAVQVFWKKGFEGTSMPDLTRAMGINRPSMYAAFGNKEALFRKVVERYMERAGGVVIAALAQPKIRDAIQNLWMAPLITLRTARPRGCLLVNSALAGTDESKTIRQELAERGGQTERAVRARLERAVKEGELRTTTNLDALAKFVATFNNGLAVQQTSCNGGAEGLTEAVKLGMAVVDAAMNDRKRKGRS